jgi:hypothetical protein
MVARLDRPLDCELILPHLWLDRRRAAEGRDCAQEIHSAPSPRRERISGGAVVRIWPGTLATGPVQGTRFPASQIFLPRGRRHASPGASAPDRRRHADRDHHIAQVLLPSLAIRKCELASGWG